MVIGGIISYITGGILLSIIAVDILCILFLPTMLSLGARRLHDVGKSGWLQLVIATGFGAFYILYLAIVPGDDGENMYGAPSTNTETDNTVATQVIATNTQTEYATAPTTTTENTVAETIHETPGILPSQNTETVATIENTNQR